MGAKPIAISSLILAELFETVEVIGIEKTIKTLKDAKLQSLIGQKDEIDMVLTAVSELTEVSKDRILSSYDRTDDRKLAMAVSVFILRSEFDYSYPDLKKIFNKDTAALYRYYEMIEKMPEKPKTEFDKKIDSVLKKIKLFLTKKKLTNG